MRYLSRLAVLLVLTATIVTSLELGFGSPAAPSPSVQSARPSFELASRWYQRGRSKNFFDRAGRGRADA
ncbi:MAG: hypothetical protein ACYC35_03225 [Pirellulales bacterium]